MEVINEVLPSDPTQLEQMAAAGPEGPIYMVNLLKFREKAEYDDGRETDLTGRQAYQLYGAAVSQLLPTFGAQFFFMGDVTFLALGQVEELWDEIAIVAYPNREALYRMSTSNDWADISAHRIAGLEGQLNIEVVMPKHLQGLPWMQLFMQSMDAIAAKKTS